MRLGTLRPTNAALASISPTTAAGMAPGVGDDEITGVRRATMTLRPTSRGKIIGQHPSIKRVLETIDRVASSMCTVLVTGESGTGKELVVAALHDASSRRTGALVTINCGAIPSELVESELFGHVKGAFTGAQNNRRGHVATAEGGTLFLDEVGELPLNAQVKLLRVLQQREYTPVGESKSIKCDVRVVAATNRDLKAEVAAGRFREDLFYRLNVIHLKLPALRERGTDVRVLASHFYRQCVKASGRDDLRGFSAQALVAIERHAWPGNVRALENAVERSVLLARGPFVEADDILGNGAGISVQMAAVSVPSSLAKPLSAGALSSVRIDTRPEGSPAAKVPTLDPREQADVRRELEIARRGVAFDARREIDSRPRIDARHLADRVGPTSHLMVETPKRQVDRHVETLDPRRAEDARRAAEATALPPPPKLARFESSPRHESVEAPAATPVAAARGSNPLFPRVLPEQGFDLFTAVESYQNNLIRQALTRTGGNKNKAAQLLGLNRTTLVEMIRRRGL
ncbi:MAG: Response regulator of zinc sigma-54-dependent two-component system [Labilithrix sp.]|nr:Response regulator of zinc sigma-54-dependent two-component system [Labilithrix sp.]